MLTLFDSWSNNRIHTFETLTAKIENKVPLYNYDYPIANTELYPAIVFFSSGKY